jgi:hypothetical protein
MKNEMNMGMDIPKMPEINETKNKEVATFKQLQALKSVVDNIKDSLRENDLLEFVQQHSMIRTYSTAEGIKSIKDLASGLGNNKFDGLSDEQVREIILKQSGLNNPSEKEKQFNELMNNFDDETSAGAKAFQGLEEAGFGDDSLLDALSSPDRLSAMIATLDAVFRSLPKVDKE